MAFAELVGEVLVCCILRCRNRLAPGEHLSAVGPLRPRSQPEVVCPSVGEGVFF